MTDPDENADDGPPTEATGDESGSGTDAGSDSEPETAEAEMRALREAVEDRYDFEEFGPREMQQMSREEWEAAFDTESWVTGTELLDRVETDLRARVERRDVFAVIERERAEGSERVLAYSDEDYAVVHPDGTVEGTGTVLRDVEAAVALCSMPDYEPQAPSGDGTLPPPESVERGGSTLGNTVMQIVGIIQLLAGVALLIGWVVFSLEVFVPIVAVAFILFGIFILVLVANARLSDRFRAEEYQQRLAGARAGSDERPAFVPGSDAQEPDTTALEGGEADDGERTG